MDADPRPRSRASQPDRALAARTLRQALRGRHGATNVAASKVASAVRALTPELALGIDEYFLSRPPENGPVGVVDLFSGCGGMSAGFLAVNAMVPAFRLLAAADLDPVANESYAANLGLVPACENVSELAAQRSRSPFLRRIKAERGREPLVLIGCAPCQGFSSHRNSTGEGDPRNGLFADFVKVALDLQPDVIVGENVPELLTDRYWPHVDNARSLLEQAGYHVNVSVHNMASFGVPQDRFRTLILASRTPLAAPAGFLGDAPRTVRDAIGDLPPLSPGRAAPEDPLHVTAHHRPSTIETIRAVPHDGGNRPPWEGPPSLQRVARRQGKPAYEDVYGRLAWDRPAITITAYARNPASGRYSHPEQDRGLSIREAALLQGFPSRYQFEGGLDACFRQIGNAVPPRFSAALALHVLGGLLGATYEPGDDIRGPVGSSFSRLIPGLKARARAERADFAQNGAA